MNFRKIAILAAAFLLGPAAWGATISNQQLPIVDTRHGGTGTSAANLAALRTYLGIGSSGGGTWGGITGTLSAQTDLATALGLLAPLTGAGTSGTWPIGITGNAGTVTNGVYTTGAGTVFLAPTGSAAALTSFPTLNQSTTGNADTATALAGTAAANTVYAGPATGVPAARTDRALVAADLGATMAITATSFAGAGTGLTGTAASLSVGGSAATVPGSGITGLAGIPDAALSANVPLKNAANTFTGTTTLIKPGTNSTTAFQVQPSASTTPVINIDTTNSRVGIGTASGVDPLTVYHANAAVMTIEQPSALFRLISSGTANYIQSGLSRTSDSAASLSFTTMNDGRTWLNIADTGKVTTYKGLDAWGGGGRSIGWGDTSELGSLSYSGTAAVVAAISGDLILRTSTITERARITTTGNVGIGTNSPASHLHVVGTAPVPVSSGNGTAATTALTVTGAAGGASTGTTPNTGGTGAGIVTTAGAGGAANGATGANTGGLGGNVTLTAGAGGASSTPTTGIGGAGGNITLTPGAGGVGAAANGRTGKVIIPLANVSIYANNAAAVAGGLTAGMIYRTGGDPDLLAIVH